MELGKKWKHFHGFAVLDGYDRNQTHVIDPELDTLMASTYPGGTESDHAYAMALDRAGKKPVPDAGLVFEKKCSLHLSGRGISCRWTDERIIAGKGDRTGRSCHEAIL
jgi:hypothetical protein